MRTTQCRSCEAPIFWAEMVSGRKAPVDLDPPRFGGNVEILDIEKDTPTARVIRKGEEVPADVVRFALHFVTCPNSDAHRRKEAKK